MKGHSHKDESQAEISLETLFDLAEASSDLIEEEGPLTEELNAVAQRYTEFSLIASGGMKIISKVRDNNTGRYVAIAQLHEDAPKELYEPFLREARLTALLDHPNIISIHNIGLDEYGAPFFTMKLRGGQGLNQLIEACHQRKTGLKPVDLDRLLEIFLKICDGMAYAHSEGVVHLDIKPENIQVGIYGEVIIFDWGLGKVLGDPSYDGGEFDQILLNPDLLNNMTQIGQVRGTPGFMAPEQIECKNKVTPRADIYSLGALLYTMLTGVPPIELAGSVHDALQRTKDGAILSMRQRFPDVEIPRGLAAVGMKALALHPRNRYESVEALRKDVVNFMAGRSTLAENAGFLKELNLFYKRNLKICMVILLFSLVTSAVTFSFMLGLHRSKAKADLARARAESSERVALREKERAENALQLYREQKEGLSFFVERHFQELRKEVHAQTDVRIFENPVLWLDEARAYLDRMIRSESRALWPYMQRGYVYFMMQDLNAANRDFAQYDINAEDLHAVSRKFADQAVSGQLLDPETLGALIGEIDEPNRRSQAVIMLLYDREKRESLTDHARIVEAVLAAYNDQWQAETFDYDEGTSSLRLGGKGLVRLKGAVKDFGNYPLLRSLDLKVLYLQRTRINNLVQLDGLGIEELDIRGSRIRDCSRSSEFLPNLKILKVSAGQVPADDPVWVREGLQIIVE